MKLQLAIAIVLIGGCTAVDAEVIGDSPTAPCAGCTLDVLPLAPRRPAPLLVVLHGNHETAETAAARWRAPALARGWIVLSLRCPRELGCDDEGRWYRWRGAPSWVLAQVAEIERRRSIDPTRIFLAGWSGGATYIGMHAASWHREFAAVVIHGGGQPPEDERCPPRALPTYFLVGDRNPAHAASVRLRDYLARCRQITRWDLVAGADHAAENRALDREKAAQILDWLEDHARTPQVSIR